MRRKLFLETFGCQMNVLDSELVLGQLRAHGYDQVDDRDAADVVIFNTCSVREHAEQKVWSRLGELRPRKAADPGMVIGVIGCMAERDGTNIFRRFPHVDVLCGPGELDKLPTLVHNAVVTNNASSADVGATLVSPASPAEEAPVGATAASSFARGTEEGDAGVAPAKNARQVALMGAAVRRSSTLAAAEDNLELLDLSRSVSPGDDVTQSYVRITRGCNKFCTYCVVPYTRGPEVHRPPQNIIDEVRKMTDAGSKEVTLLGQTINHYAYKHGDGRTTSFAELLYRIHEAVPELPRLRFVTSFPRDFTDEALQAMRDCERICRFLHVPAQHGSDRVLKLMNRGYTAQQYIDFVGRARAYMPDVSIASDFIVGFPTETDAEFQQTVDLVKLCRFKNSFIFKYSPRPGTVAIDRFADDVLEDVKRRRNNELLAVQQQVTLEENRKLIGRTVEVMVEGESKMVSKQAAYPTSRVELGWEKRTRERHGHFSDHVSTPARTQLVGRTRGDQVVCFDGDLTLKGAVLNVEIADSRGMTLFARLADPVLAT